MSLSLDIPLKAPLKIQKVLQGTRLALLQLLRVPEIPEMHAEIVCEGVVMKTLPQLLNEEAGMLLIYLANDYRIEVMSFKAYTSNLEDGLTADVSVHGGGGTTRPKFVMAAACAIAIAREANSIIEDGALQWGSRFEYEAETFLNTLKCKTEHGTIQEALTEVLENIEENKVSAASRGQPAPSS